MKLFINYFIDGDQKRHEEILTCLRKNSENSYITKIYCVSDVPCDIPDYNKLEQIIIHERPTYNVFFELINSLSPYNDICILANSDIYFDSTLQEVNRMETNEVYALCRWEDKPEGISFLNRWDSQDAWIFKGNIRKMDADFTQGLPGSDNAIADRLSRAGYIVRNPSLTVKTYHLHNSGIRHYDLNSKAPMPYKMITPHQ